MPPHEQSIAHLKCLVVSASVTSRLVQAADQCWTDQVVGVQRWQIED